LTVLASGKNNVKLYQTSKIFDILGETEEQQKCQRKNEGKWKNGDLIRFATLVNKLPSLLFQTEHFYIPIFI